MFYWHSLYLYCFYFYFCISAHTSNDCISQIHITYAVIFLSMPFTGLSITIHVFGLIHHSKLKRLFYKLLGSSLRKESPWIWLNSCVPWWPHKKLLWFLSLEQLLQERSSMSHLNSFVCFLLGVRLWLQSDVTWEWSHLKTRLSCMSQMAVCLTCLGPWLSRLGDCDSGGHLCLFPGLLRVAGSLPAWPCPHSESSCVAAGFPKHAPSKTEEEASSCGQVLRFGFNPFPVGPETIPQGRVRLQCVPWDNAQLTVLTSPQCLPWHTSSLLLSSYLHSGASIVLRNKWHHSIRAFSFYSSHFHVQNSHSQWLKMPNPPKRSIPTRETNH